MATSTIGTSQDLWPQSLNLWSGSAWNISPHTSYGSVLQWGTKVQITVFELNSDMRKKWSHSCSFRQKWVSLLFTYQGPAWQSWSLPVQTTWCCEPTQAREMESVSEFHNWPPFNCWWVGIEIGTIRRKKIWIFQIKIQIKNQNSTNAVFSHLTQIPHMAQILVFDLNYHYFILFLCIFQFSECFVLWKDENI